ncbi:hypothetical protein [Bartonella schoenbuchensis]|uniref:hypothetical protein n=1 Tax=Bartonella schoenbuchensis TaxID=165694 RepID=UPI00159EE4FE|nr:hypothetical protein [Bartonella schoenbuchensis]
MRGWGVEDWGDGLGEEGQEFGENVGGRRWHLRGKGRGRCKVEGAGSGGEETGFFKMVARFFKSVEKHV